MTTAVSPSAAGLPTLAEVESAALALAVADRMQLVRVVIASIDNADESEEELTEEDRLWWATIERRIQEVREGQVVLRDGPTVMKELLARYA